jgi:hypothetical protein
MNLKRLLWEAYPQRTACCRIIRKSLNLAGEVPVRPSRVKDIVRSENQISRFVGRRRQAMAARKRQIRRLENKL